MTDKLIILTSVDKEERADKIATTLVERRQAACVNVLPMGLSVYRWKDKIHRDHEYLLLIKTSAHLFNDVRDTIRELHPYELPAIHAFAFEHVYAAYAEWIAENAGG